MPTKSKPFSSVQSACLDKKSFFEDLNQRNNVSRVIVLVGMSPKRYAIQDFMDNILPQYTDDLALGVDHSVKITGWLFLE